MVRKQKIDRYRCAKCPVCGRMMEKMDAPFLRDKKNRIVYPANRGEFLSVWFCTSCYALWFMRLEE